MKKKMILMFAFILLLVSVFCAESVLAGGLREKIDYCDIARQNNILSNHLIGCDCKTGSSIDLSANPFVFDWARSDWSNPGRDDREDDGIKYYCYVDNPMSTAKPGTGSGTGEIRMCTEDEYSEYKADYTGGSERNSECSFTAPFCDKNKNSCNECRNNNDCLNNLNAQVLQNSGKSFQTQCMLNDNLGDKSTKSCEYCINIAGSGSKKIVFVVGQAPPGKTQEDVIQEAYQSVVQTEPFRYLHEEKNAFTFSYIPINDFNTWFKDFAGRYFIINSGRPVIYTGAGKEIEKKAEQICGTDSLIIYIDYFNNIKGSYYSEQEYELIVMSSSDLGENIVSHELGHAIGRLSDEYALLSGRKRVPAIQREGINIQTPNDVGVNLGNCIKFTNFGVDLPNCFSIATIYFGNKGIEEVFNIGYKKSIESSLMNINKEESRFNTISCAGILNQVLGTPIERAVYYCKGTELAPDKNGQKIYDISKGIIQQN